jgi:general secretion pathway protein G
MKITPRGSILSQTSRQDGFTLIELLVVIAIIGVLASVVLASLSTARNKGNDVGVLANVDSMATQAAIYQGNNNSSYGTYDNGSGGPKACPKAPATGSAVFYDPTMEHAIAAAITDSAGGTALCYAANTIYAVAVSRPAAVVPTKSYFWCTDSTGTKCGNDGNNGDGATPIVNGACVPCTIDQ